VVLAMLMILASVMIGVLNPITQFQKAQDAQREHDLTQISAALDAYFNDNSCYPQASSFSFGSSWSQGPYVYMSKVPQDPSCSGGNNCYIYLTDKNSTCPQWNVILAKVSSTAGPKISCILNTSCFPVTYANQGYNYCAVSGKPDCSILSQLPGGGGAPTSAPTVAPTLPPRAPTPGGGGVPTASPTLTPTPISGQNCRIRNWDCRPNGDRTTCNNVCAPGDPGFPNCNNGNFCDSTCGGQC